MDKERVRDTRKNAGAGTDHRAVSEVLSYSLIFGLIVASIAIVTVGGMSGLENVRTNEQLSNGERAFNVLHDNLRAVHSEGAPSRATEVSLGDSQIFFGDNITMRVVVEDDSGATTDLERKIRPLIFRVESERQIVYEAGTVLRTSRNGGVVLNPPPFTMVEGSGGADTGQVHLPIIQTTATSVQSLGSTTVLVRGQSENRSVLASDINEKLHVNTIEIESPRSDIWANYLDQQDYCASVSQAGSTTTCTIDGDYEPKQLYVTIRLIRIDLIN